MARQPKASRPNGALNGKGGERELLFMIEGKALLDMTEDELNRLVDQAWQEFERRSADRDRDQRRK